MIDEDLFDEDFAENWTFGLRRAGGLHPALPPEVAEDITGFRPRRFGISLAASPTRPARARSCTPASSYSDTGLQAIRAILALFALGGQLDIPGGIGLAMPGTHFPINRSCNVVNPDLRRALARDRYPLYSQFRGESHRQRPGRLRPRGEPYRIRALIIHGASILTSWAADPTVAPHPRRARVRGEHRPPVDRRMRATPTSCCPPRRCSRSTRTWCTGPSSACARS